jgi:hypothetical protein
MTDLPSPDQVNAAVNHTALAINAIKVAWYDWAPIIALVYPAIVHALAAFKKLQTIPFLGPFLNVVVGGNYGAAANKP